MLSRPLDEARQNSVAELGERQSTLQQNTVQPLPPDQLKAVSPSSKRSAMPLCELWRRRPQPIHRSSSGLRALFRGCRFTAA